MFWLVISIVALLVGLLLSAFLKRSYKWSSLLMGFVIGSIGLLLFLEIMPHVITTIGISGWIWFVFGLVLVALVDRFSSQFHRSISLIVLSVTFGIHALLDGVGLAVDSEYMMIMAVIAHRVPEGMAVGSKFSRVRYQALVFSVMSVASAIGFFSVQSLPLETLSIFQALACGGLAHILLHTHISEVHPECLSLEFCVLEPVSKFWRLGGLLTAIGLFVLVLHNSSSHSHHLDITTLSVVTLGLLGVVLWERNHSVAVTG